MSVIAIVNDNRDTKYGIKSLYLRAFFEKSQLKYIGKPAVRPIRTSIRRMAQFFSQ